MIDADQIPANALKGLKVLNLAVNVPGPWAAARLGMFGAEVTKVEPPTGDPLEAWCPSWYAEMASSASTPSPVPAAPGSTSFSTAPTS